MHMDGTCPTSSWTAMSPVGQQDGEMNEEKKRVVSYVLQLGLESDHSITSYSLDHRFGIDKPGDSAIHHIFFSLLVIQNKY
jgi:hypothetical protein